MSSGQAPALVQPGRLRDRDLDRLRHAAPVTGGRSPSASAYRLGSIGSTPSSLRETSWRWFGGWPLTLSSDP